MIRNNSLITLIFGITCISILHISNNSELIAPAGGIIIALLSINGALFNYYKITKPCEELKKERRQLNTEINNLLSM